LDRGGDIAADIAASVTTFAATNIDDLFLLAVFCAK
jgi:cadmium resistance protein CadD (predicted permease)